MTTRQEFRDGILRGLLASITDFPDALLNTWIEEAILDYSLYFPRQISKTIEAAASGQQEFWFISFGPPESVFGITRVEYPVGAAPRSFLQRLPRSHPAFQGGLFYDLSGDYSLEVGIPLQQGETIQVIYLTHHQIPDGDQAALSVPEGHLEALKLYVMLQALRKLEVAQAAPSTPDAALLSTLGGSASRAARAYLAVIRSFLQAAGQGVTAGPWSMDRWDRVY